MALTGPLRLSAVVLLVLGAVTTAPVFGKDPMRIYVAPDGHDIWSGRLPRPNLGRTDGPFATLERARDNIRELKRKGRYPQGGVIVDLRGGEYERQRVFELTAADSGRKGAPIVYRASPGETVRLIGGRFLPRFSPVTNRTTLQRLDESARKHVVQINLKTLRILSYGSAVGGGLELFFDDKPMTLARWPNSGFVRIAGLVGGSPIRVHGISGDKIGKLIYEGDRPQRWVAEPDLWLHGYWFWDWSDQRQKVQSIDTTRRIISLSPPYHGYGYRKGQWYYAFNALSELDSPGEWYLDRKAGLLYFWPPASLSKNQAIVSVLPSLVTMRDVSYVRFQRLTFEASRGTGIIIRGGDENRIEECTLKNLGGWGVTISGGRRHLMSRCDVHAVGGGGISLTGGDRKTLTPAAHEAVNNHIHHYGRWKRMYQPAVSVHGVGNRVTHNLIHDAPHQAISFGGNDHVIEFNDIHDVCTESNDAGAVYSGRDWSMRGTVIRYNYFHNINGFRGKGCMGVYLDDMYCGTTIFGNVFYRVSRAAFIGGGRDNIVENNIFVECEPAVHVDARALGWAGGSVKTTMIPRLKSVPYRQPPWSRRYPKLVGILADDPAVPKGNIVRRNISYRSRWSDINKQASPYVTVEHNLLDQDPHFVDAAKLNFQLKPDSPAYRIGFQRIPFDKIGRQRRHADR